MTVAEMIEKLSKMPPDLPVKYWDEETYYDVHVIGIEDRKHPQCDYRRVEINPVK